MLNAYEKANDCIIRNAILKTGAPLLTTDTRLVDDLGYDSVRAITLLVDLETSFGIAIYDEGVNFEHAFRTVGDIYRFLDAVVPAPQSG